MSMTLPNEVVRALAEGVHETPADVLGLRSEDGAVICRAWQPHATRVDLIDFHNGRTLPMRRIHEAGLFEWSESPGRPFRYRFRMTDAQGNSWEGEDPYRFPFVLSSFDLHLFNEGTNFRAFEKMGAHPRVVEGVAGSQFAVWAPNALRVSVVGPFNRWDGRCHPMQKRGPGGVWELFVPGIGPGEIYKFEIKGPQGFLQQKSDPYGFAAELRPRSASVVWDPARYTWGDGEWMAARGSTEWHRRPVTVYEVHAGSWMHVREEGGRWLTYRELADRLVPYARDLGYTHIELLPVSEHPFDGSWGYQTIGYFAPTSRFGTPDDFRYFVDACHRAGLGVLVDWVPAHFPRDAHGLARFDGTHLYEHADPRQGEHRDWGTLIFNYGRHEVRAFLLSSAIWWAETFHIDGLRVDAVASMLYLDYSRKPGEWIPNKFGGRENLEAVDLLRRFNEIVHAECPGFLTFAEESTAWPMVSRPVYLGGLGFDFKWNMGWMHDILEYFSKEPVHRKYHHNSLTFSMIYAFTENFILPFSHDEVVHGKRSMLDRMPGDLWQKFANLRLLYGLMAAHPGKKLLFMGGEFGQWAEWNHHAGLDWALLDYDAHRGLQALVRDLNRAIAREPALHEVDFAWEGFEWIDIHDSEQSVLSFVRKAEDPADLLVCVLNFTPVPRHGYRIGVPLAGAYREVLNTDAACYGGSNVGNLGVVEAGAKPWNGRPQSLLLSLPPLGALFLKPTCPAASGTEPVEPPPP
jgi:1,4-alpha-glucan branching enzyme